VAAVDDDEVRRVARRLRDLVEPVAANVYFARPARARYEALGLSYAPGYFASRGACLGQVPGEVIAAAFGVFKPAAVVAAVHEAWAKTDAATILAAREAGAVESLEQIFGADARAAEIERAVPRATELLREAAAAAPPGEGRALYSGLSSLGYPGTPIGDLWRACDLVREHRGDSHVIAWVAHGLDPIEATITTELWWRLPLRSYVRTRYWTDDEIDGAIDNLRRRGLVDGDALTADGESLRAEIEACTDRQERPIAAAIAGHAEELFALLTPLAEAVLAAKGYPADPRRMTRP
jgi:hypothetical protein